MFPISLVLTLSVKPYWTTLQSSPTNGWTTPGISTTLNCSTNARPPATGYEFYHNGKLLYKGRSNSYNITSVKISDGGLYKCVPSNAMGRGDEASLNVMVTGWMLTERVVNARL